MNKNEETDVIFINEIMVLLILSFIKMYVIDDNVFLPIMMEWKNCFIIILTYHRLQLSIWSMVLGHI